MSRVIGIDASLSATGWVILEDGKLFDKGTIKPKTRGAERLAEITAFLANICILKGVGPVAMEALSFGSPWGTIPLAELHGALKQTFHVAALAKPFMVAPTTLKKYVTGSGRGEKSDVKMSIFKQWGLEFNDNNQADAFGLAQIAYRLSPGAPKPPHKYQQECLAVVLAASNSI